MKQTHNPLAMSPTLWAMLILLSFVWGGTFFFQEIAVRELPVFTIVAVRVVVAAAFLSVILILSGQRFPKNWEIWRALVLLAIINNVIPFYLIVWGQKEIASGLAAILNAATPICTVLVAHFLTTDEKITYAKLIGVFAGLIGVMILIGIDVMEGLGSAVTAQFAVLGAAFAYSFGAIYGRKFRSMGLTATGTAAGQLLASSIILVPIALLVDTPWSLETPSVNAIAALICLGSVSTALAYWLYFRILERAGATNLVLATFLIPVSAVLLGLFILNVVLLMRHIFGMIFIGAGLVAIDGRLLPARLR
ncbi:MAG: DMT family transporter [Pseudomonadota bacterium]|nr:DMT family transporter [Pseudomonadota bacterium]